jgi:transcriptional regulator with XRE-family HTH domain
MVTESQLPQVNKLMVNLLGMEKTGFAQRFKQAVEEAGVEDSQEALGRLLGVSGVMIWAYRSGEKLPRMTTATRIADKLGVNVNWLLTGKGPKNPERLGIAEQAPHSYYVPEAPDILQRLPIIPWERVTEWLDSPFQTEYSVPIWRRPGAPAKPPYSEKAFALTVETDQWSPELSPGTTLFIDPAAASGHKGWVLVQLPSRPLPGIWRAVGTLDPAKPALTTITTTNAPAEPMPAGSRILGSVLYVLP